MKKFILKTALFGFYLCSIFAQQTEYTYRNEGPKKFEFKYRENDSYRILSTVNEDVYYNGIHHHTADILNRVSVKVTSVDTENKTAVHSGTFMTSENSVIANPYGGNNSKIFTYGEEYKSVFTRDRFGVYTIDDEYFMPVVRDVPVFPDKEIAQGEKWNYKGHEAHDMRKMFGLKKPYKVPFDAHYTYLGIVNQDGKKFDVLQVYYEMSFSIEPQYLSNAGETPQTTRGFSSQLIFWDSEKGVIDHYVESFEISILTTYSNVLTFRGTAKAEVTDFERTSTKENIDKVAKSISELGLDDVNVKMSDKGLTISIENIQFEPDSAVLMNSEKEKLKKIADIIKKYPNNDLLVTGHTALRGTAESRQTLSEERAESVAQYLIALRVKDAHNIFTQGKGAEEPIATNKTESGRQKNRRVEITILDN